MRQLCMQVVDITTNSRVQTNIGRTCNIKLVCKAVYTLKHALINLRIFIYVDLVLPNNTLNTTAVKITCE